jgi:beta-N-acetylhexosaminidase
MTHDPGRGAAIFGCAGTVLGADERAFFRDYDPFGFILFARNVETPEQLRRLTADLRAAVGRDAPILVDQEGGRVQRLRAPYWREWSPPLDAIQSAGPSAGRMMYLRMRILAQELADVGIDANCAPVCDIAEAETHAFLRNRCYGDNPKDVARIARAVAKAHLDAGVLPVVKHVPGHGRARADSHKLLPQVDVGADELRQWDFAPFRALADLPMAMTAHIVFSAHDARAPATQSAEMIRIIREEIGFSGLLMSDDVNMQALSGSLADRAARSLAAGCDLVLHCKGDLDEMRAVAAVSGDMAAPARRRAIAALRARKPALPVDISMLEAELSAVDAQACHG